MWNRIPFEDSEYTNVKDRMEERSDPAADQFWLCPINEQSTEGRRGILPMTRDGDLTLIDWTGRQVQSDKTGVISAHLVPPLDRLAINQSRWVGTVNNYDSHFHRVAGRVESIASAARQAVRCWLAFPQVGRPSRPLGPLLIDHIPHCLRPLKPKLPTLCSIFIFVLAIFRVCIESDQWQTGNHRHGVHNTILLHNGIRVFIFWITIVRMIYFTSYN